MLLSLLGRIDFLLATGSILYLMHGPLPRELFPDSHTPSLRGCYARPLN